MFHKKEKAYSRHSKAVHVHSLDKRRPNSDHEAAEYFTYSSFQMVKNIAIIGSTGSLGRQVLEVIKAHPGKWRVATLAAYNNETLLREQVDAFKPDVAALFNANGVEGWMEAATHPGVDKVFFVSSGVEALPALYAAIEAKKEIALANKEMIVAEGEKIMSAAKRKGVTIIPVDSEHSAIFQCLQGEDPASVEKVILTCSGGPLYGKCGTDISGVTREQALAHPTWKMGEKISVDSATLMNKAFEIIEAKHLFGLHEKQIEVVIHPESIIHSLVQFKDGSVKAQLGLPDMRTAITYALSWPERIKTDLPRLDLSNLKNLTFLKPDFSYFKGPELARRAIIKGGNAPAKLREANDQAVQKFLDGKIKFCEIYNHIIQKTAL